MTVDLLVITMIIVVFLWSILFYYFHFSCMQILNECNKAEQWLRERTQQQESLSKNTDPVLWSSDIKKMTEDLDLYNSFTSIFHFIKLKYFILFFEISLNIFKL